MDREERLKSFREFIEDGNELTVGDMMAVVIGNLSIEGQKEFHDIFMVGNKAYVVDIKETRIS